MFEVRESGQRVPVMMLCYQTIAFGGYERYAPLFAYSALKLSPGASVVIHIGTKSTPYMRDVAQQAIHRFGGDIQYETEKLNRFSHEWKGGHLVGGVLKAARWVLEAADAPDSAATFIGHVDTVFLPGTGYNINSHLAFMEKTGLPFFNWRRGHEPRLSGGNHLVQARTYNQQTGGARNAVTSAAVYASLLEAQTKASKGKDSYPRDENVLYWICNRVYDLNALPQATFAPAEVRIPGLHLGAGRRGTQPMSVFRGALIRERARLFARMLESDSELDELVRDLNDDRVWSLLVFAGRVPRHWSNWDFTQWRYRVYRDRLRNRLGGLLKGQR